MSYTHENLSLVGLHEPDYSLDPGPDGNKVRTELPGNYTIGVEIEGAFVPLARFPAGRLFKDMRLAQERGYEPKPEAASDSRAKSEEVAALYSRVAALEAAQSSDDPAKTGPQSDSSQTPDSPQPQG